ncbi:MAG: pyruvate, phosphate dikinase [Nitrospinota bacterium]
MTRKMVYAFGGSLTEGRADMRELLGGKGANLAEMANLGIPVPPGFTITTEACLAYLERGTYPEGLWEEVREGIRRLEREMGAEFGGEENPLLVSVRSGAAVSMPGMMDTVLNLGLNGRTVEGLARRSGNRRFALDSYRRFATMFGDVVVGIPREEFEGRLAAKKAERGVTSDTDLGAEALSALVEDYRRLVEERTGEPFPEDVHEQLRMTISAVFRSWNNERAVTYRRLHGIAGDAGTAANVQCMVFGNLGERSGTGVAFSRDPGSGEKRFYGDFLLNAQGEDVVAGIRTPEPLDQLRETMPEAYGRLEEINQTLERHYRDLQDMEFTIQEGKLYMLQTRAGKRTAAAAVRIAVEMVEEGLLDQRTALLRVGPEQLDQLFHPTVDPRQGVRVIAKGLAASPGGAVGRVVFSPEEAEAQAALREKVILVRRETSPEDIGGMAAAEGILTARGGTSSHAALVARGMGKPCVVGCEAIQIREHEGCFAVDELVVRKGEFITLNGNTGEVILGKANLIQPETSGDFARLMQWADGVRKLGVRANADTPHDAKVARDFGAEGIGLTRTEHMFFERGRIDAVRWMILAEDAGGRREALARILPMQKGDFREIFKVMDGLPVTIRLLDPPLHEFLPKSEREIAHLADSIRVSPERVRRTVESHAEFNPMLGHRGCRLGVTFPEIYEMQTRAIMEAACEVSAEGRKVLPEIMIPLAGDGRELSVMTALVRRVAEEVLKERGIRVDYQVGTMIELPRACVLADQIAREAEFFSFGTNDLTQTTYGVSRDDAGKFLPAYLDQGIFPHDPFVTIDREGVGELVRIGVEKGRRVHKGMKMGICGEHGGDPASVAFCHEVGLTYVSCTPFRVPIARLAAAQAALIGPG